MSASPTNAKLARPGQVISSNPAEDSIPGQPPAYYAPGREALQALLAFSSLHAQIRHRRNLKTREGATPAKKEIWKTEQFQLDEVLQLVSERALAITGTDGVAIALAEGDEIRCRASAGPMAPDVGARLDPNSGFSGACLRTGLIVRCDDSEKDPRVDREACRRLGLRSIVAVPLMTEHGVIGLLAGFCSEAFGFNDSDVRSLSLLAELILAAMKPEEEEVPRTQAATPPVEATRQSGWPERDIPKVEAVPVQAPPIEASAAPLKTEASNISAPPIAEPLAEPEEFASAPSEEVQATGSGRDDAAAFELPNMHALREALARVTEESSQMPVSEDARAPEIFPTFSLSQHPFLQSAEPQEDKRGPMFGIALLVILSLALLAGGLWWWETHHKSKAVTAVSQTAPASDSITPADPSLPAAGEIAATEPEQKEVATQMTGVRHWSSSDSSTVAIDLQNQVQYEAHRLTNPERIYFDLHGTTVGTGKPSSIEVGDALLVRIRVAQPSPDVTRIVLETKDSPNFSVSMETNPYRLVVEISSVSTKPKNTKLNLFGPARPARASEQRASGRAPSKGWLEPPPAPSMQGVAHVAKFRIVLDAGHGGWDLGTVGRKGLLEKNLVLDIVARLGNLVTGRLNAEVIYTRRDDTYVPLEQRTETANLSQADMFLSVHGNYSDLPSARGVETYYTNTYSSIHARTHQDEGAEETNVALTNVDVREKVLQSKHLAERVQQALYQTLKHDSDMRNRGVKQASYVVLTGTTMPAVLAEVSFVSSPTDEERMENPEYRQQIAEALYKGVAAYAESAHRVNMASASARPAGQ